MEQFEQLLTCAICLDRYRNPKLLPCQHSFCMEPCMDGLVDYVRRQVKCPECRAEHRIPYQGVQGFPTNVTLQRFLELHIEITGELPDPNSGQIMKRCSVCSEKAYCTLCLHCDKEVCPECKNAHKDILRREISRINNQIRRALHRLEDILAHVEKNMIALQQNCTSVSEEVEELYNRLNKALKDRTEYLRNEIDRYLTTEHKNLSSLKENLEVEISNIQSNCDLADKYMQTEIIDWDDCELMDAKEIFLKTVEFIRYFEAEPVDYNRRAKFIMSHDPNQLVGHVSNYGDISINMPHQPFLSTPSMGAMLQPPSPGLMRSKSDHRLTSQYRQQDDRGFDNGGDHAEAAPLLGGRKFGERYVPRNAGIDRYEPSSGSRYGRGERSDYGGDFDSPYDNEGGRITRSRFRSRLGRHDNADSDTDTQTAKSVRFLDPHAHSAAHPKERERVLDTEDVAKGPISGITRLYDSPRVMKRIQESETKSVKKAKEQQAPPVQQKTPAPISVTQQRRPSNSSSVARQISDDDEISRIKRQNKGAGPSGEGRTTEMHRISTDRSSGHRDSIPEERALGSRGGSATDRTQKTPARETASSEETDEDGRQLSTLQQKQQQQRKSAASTAPSGNRSSMVSTNVRRSSGQSDTTGNRSSVPSTVNHEKTKAEKVQEEEEEEEEDEEEEEEEEEEESTSTSSESEETESEEEPSKETQQGSSKTAMEKTDIGPLLARSAQARDVGTSGYRRSSRDDGGHTSSRYTGSSDGYKYPYSSSKETSHARGGGNSNGHGGGGGGGGSKYLSRNASDEGGLEQPKSRFTSRFLNKSKSSAMALAGQADDSDYYQSSGSTGNAANKRYGSSNDSSRDRYATFKDRKARLTRSKSTHGFGIDDTNDPEDTITTSSSASSYYPTSYLAAKGAAVGSAANDLTRSRSSHVLKSRENSPEHHLATTTSAAEKDGSSLSSWARYLKNKYGSRGKDVKDSLPLSSSTSTAGPSTSASTSRRLSLGLPLRHNSSTVESSDDDQKNPKGSPNSPTAATVAQAGFTEVGTTLRSQYMQKRQLLFEIGSRGSESGAFTWPRGIAVGPDNSIVVADSSNHRVQVFDQHGRFLKEFGSYGNKEGEFDCLAGIAVNRIGQYIIADRYNHRIQVLDPSGRFLRAFGSQGTTDGKFNYPWGITTDALGFIYVCDKENHRIQVFQSDGTFVGKFGSCGSKLGQLEHPHYIAVSNTNRVIVSDSNNHRVQIFDVNGRALSSIGSEGSAEGQFKFPKGVAVDDQGYILVGDSGNNRIQIFHPDGTFLRTFGCWGCGEGEFKGLEGIAVMSNGNILVCDRENHRIQVF